MDESPNPVNDARAAHGIASRWFSAAEIESLRDVRDEIELAHRIAPALPGASREEILFRYHLSRRVYHRDLALPILPFTASEIYRLSRNPDATVREYVAVVERDPALVAAVVRLANSTFFAAVRACEGLREAIVRVGLGEVEKIVMVEAYRSRVFRVSGHERRVDLLVEHGIRTAVTSQEIAASLKAGAAASFLAGLFHDVGKLLLLRTIERVQHRLRWRAPEGVVLRAFDAFHTVVGELICREYEFPEPVCDAVRRHHDPPADADGPIRTAVRLGNDLAHAMESAGRPGLDALEARFHRVGIDRPRLERIRDRAAERLSALRTTS